jgi:hypothetical protein
MAADRKGYTRKLVIEATLVVEQMDDETLPTPERVLEAWGEYASELLSYKELAETYGGDLSAAITIEVNSTRLTDD